MQLSCFHCLAAKIQFWSALWHVSGAPSFFIEMSCFFDDFFDAQPFKNGDFPQEKLIFLMFIVFGT